MMAIYFDICTWQYKGCDVQTHVDTIRQIFVLYDIFTGHSKFMILFHQLRLRRSLFVVSLEADIDPQRRLGSNDVILVMLLWIADKSAIHITLQRKYRFWTCTCSFETAYSSSRRDIDALGYTLRWYTDPHGHKVQSAYIHEGCFFDPLLAVRW
jgi:hypothetical protein